MNFLKRNSIRTSLLVRMVGMTAAVGILIGLATDIILYCNSNSDMQARIKGSTAAYKTSIQNAVQIYESRAEAIAQNSQITDTALSSLDRKVISSSLAQKYGFSDIIVTDDTGKYIDGTENYGNEDYFKKAEDGSTTLSSTVKWQNSSSPVFIVATKIINGSGAVLCVLPSNVLSKMIDEVDVGAYGYGFLVDKSGKIVAHKDRSIVSRYMNYIDEAKKNSSYSDAASLIQQMKSGKSGICSVRINSIRQCVCYAPVSGTDGWSLGISANEHEMMGGFYISLIFTVLLLTLLIILSVFISSKMANRITKPIVSLVGRIEKLTDGDLHSEVPVIVSKDEIGTFSESFVATVSTLKNYVTDISDVLNSLAKGDCTTEIQQQYAGDFTPIKASLETIISNLNSMFTKIDQAANQVSASAMGMAGASQTLAQGSSEQAEALEKLTSSISEISKKVNKTASDAATAKEYSQQAFAEVENGNQQMQRTKSAMNEIKDFSTQIGKINGIISNIAFQTNILALNASVEAARAGESGKGFAVVAGEVRNLASKSAEAAKSTTALIEGSIKSVENGSKIAENAAQSLNNIVSGTQKTVDLIGGISNASEEQAAFLSQIDKEMDEISAVVQTNSATSEEATATSEELSRQAQLLKTTLSFFKLRSGAESLLPKQY